jgi:hypothetical protein
MEHHALDGAPVDRLHECNFGSHAELARPPSLAFDLGAPGREIRAMSPGTTAALCVAAKGSDARLSPRANDMRHWFAGSAAVHQHEAL